MLISTLTSGKANSNIGEPGIQLPEGASLAIRGKDNGSLTVIGGPS